MDPWVILPDRLPGEEINSVARLCARDQTGSEVRVALWLIRTVRSWEDRALCLDGASRGGYADAMLGLFDPYPRRRDLFWR
jgi:hypothetical protein